ncbi:hypothetical protein LTR70_010829, partial [Exophiala xenobiotica]
GGGCGDEDCGKETADEADYAHADGHIFDGEDGGDGALGGCHAYAYGGAGEAEESKDFGEVGLQI